MTDKAGVKLGDKSGTPSRARAQPAPALRGAVDSLATEQVFRALANSSRRDILTMLHAHHGPLTSGQIAGHFESSWQTISRHLKVLEEAGLISFERRGRDRAYTIDTARQHAVVGQWLRGFAGTGSSPAETSRTKE
jgi:DNA-binding transcriptional ArsR family regulator